MRGTDLTAPTVLLCQYQVTLVVPIPSGSRSAGRSARAIGRLVYDCGSDSTSSSTSPSPAACQRPNPRLKSATHATSPRNCCWHRFLFLTTETHEC